MGNEIKISVIVPIYGVERFIKRCAESLLKQTLNDIELIFVNDATKDNSMKILHSVIEHCPNTHKKIHILTHTQNLGLPSARNTGLSVATGEYIFHCDSDDFLELDAMETMYSYASRENVDVLWSDWYLNYESSQRYMKQPSYNNSLEAMKAMLGGAMKFNVWNKLVRRKLYLEHHIKFPDGYGMGEDMTMILLMSYAQKVFYLPKAFYHYVKTNIHAFSQTYSDKHLKELQYNVARVEDFLVEKYGKELNREINFFKLEAKYPFLISADSKKYALWTSWYPEANKFITENTYVSSRSRFLQRCASSNRFGFVRLYYWIVVRFIYKIFYN